MSQQPIQSLEIAFRLGRPVLALAFFSLALTTLHAQPADDGIDLPGEIGDPFEPLNRLMWGVNKSVTNGVLRPIGKGYKKIVGKKSREGVNNFSHNIDYPRNVINHALQGENGRANDESRRFLTNSTEGILGVYDPATKRKDIPDIDADFGQTLGKWGWQDPRVYYMLPAYGPSNGRDVLGLVGDAATRPANYFWPYGFIEYGFTFNEYTDKSDEFKRFTTTHPDSYDFLKQSWTYVRRNKVDEFVATGDPDGFPLETLQAIFFDVQDPTFPNRSRTRSARISTTGRQLKFTYWLQPEPAPVVYIIPGLGAHRLERSAVALAELIYKKGYSPVTVSSGFHPEFLKAASSTGLPAYSPVDSHDLHVALTEIDHRIEGMHPGRLGTRSLLGYSMGGFYSLVIAAGEKQADSSLLRFERFVAVNTPVSLLHGMAMLDNFFKAPLVWDSAERTDRIDHTFRKVIALTQADHPSPGGLPFDIVESKFLIGYVYRTTLRDVIFSSQLRENQGVLTEPIRPLRRSAAYREIYEYSYADYLDDFVIPYYQSRDIDLAPRSALEQATNLRSYASGLRGNSKVSLVMNRNDFLLAPGDLAWLQSVVPSSRVKIFQKGGHMGNLKEEEVQDAILNRFSSALPLPRHLD